MSGDSSFEHVDAVDAKNDSFEMIGDDEMAKIERNIEESWEVLTRQDLTSAAHDTYNELLKEATREHNKLQKARWKMGNLSRMENGLAAAEYKECLISYTTVCKKLIAVSKRTGDTTLESMLKGAVKEDVIKMKKRRTDAAVSKICRKAIREMEEETDELTRKQAEAAERMILEAHKRKNQKK